MSHSITRKLQVFVNRSQRRILHVRWLIKITNEELLSRTNKEKIDIQIREEGNGYSWDIH